MCTLHLYSNQRMLFVTPRNILEKKTYYKIEKSTSDNNYFYIKIFFYFKNFYLKNVGFWNFVDVKMLCLLIILE